MMRDFKIEDLFTVKSGDYHATKELDAGSIPLISCGDTDNGLVGYFDIPESKRYFKALTVAYNGRPLMAKFHPYSFGAKDDVAVLLPKGELKQETLIYIAALFNTQIWRYSYGRKCFREKMKKIVISLPTLPSGKIDENYISKMVNPIHEYLPAKNKVEEISYGKPNWKAHIITDIFDLQRGDFHSLSNLDRGKMITVSRVSNNNGVVGYYEPPEKAVIYPPKTLTVSTVTGDAFVQLKKFIATDNVVICIPKIPLQLTSLFFVQLMINQTKWRYSYGRQCYKTKFAQTQIYLPVKKNGELDEEYMENLIKNTPYWNLIYDELNQ